MNKKKRRRRLQREIKKRNKQIQKYDKLKVARAFRNIFVRNGVIDE